jgi:hypothetical protein
VRLIYQHVALLDPEGVVQPPVCGTEQFLREAFTEAERRFGLERTESGWLMQKGGVDGREFLFRCQMVI